MSTTSLFVELVVIGSGTMAWILLLVVGCLGLDPVRFHGSLSPAILVVLLPVVYLLGILSDRFADSLLSPWDKALRGQVFDSRDEYFEDHRTLRTGSPVLAELLDYGRSRMRICRGWVLNSAFLALAWPFCIVRVLRSWQLGLAGSASALLLFVLCLVVWRDLTLTEYRKVRRQAEYVRSNSGTGSVV
jgi:hypothetical protein